METGLLKDKKKTNIPYMCIRGITIISIALMFFPALSPTNFITQAGQAKIKGVASLFTSGVSYSSLTSGLERAFDKGWLNETYFMIMFVSCFVFILGTVALTVAMCMSLGNLKLKNMANKPLLGGAAGMLLGMAGVTVSYILITNSMDTDKVTTVFPTGLPMYIGITAVIFVLAVYIRIRTPKAQPNEKPEMESKYKLFLMLLPFLLLVFAFSYLPLFSWRYAFFDYEAGGELTAENFVGLKWFKLLISNPAYTTRLIRVLRNTLVMSFLGIATSWVPMIFAIFLSEIRSVRFKRFVQLATTIPNFISWVLVYAIAFAMFNTDGFVNTFINSLGGNADTNYLLSSDFMWIKMLLWGIWKSLGWSAIIYISGIAGIDQQLYEAATVDGAGRFQKMRYVTLPGLLPTYVVMLVMSIAGILSNGMDQYLVFTNANNKNVIEVLDLYVYNLGIGSGDIPLSTVVGMTKSIISVALLFVANKVSKAIRGENVV